MSDTPRVDAQVYGGGRPRYVPTEFARELERELAEARDALKFRRELYVLQADRLRNVHATLREEQRLHVQTLNERDRLAEALRKCILWAECMAMRCEDRDNINWSYLNDAREALAAVEGESHE